MDIICGLCGEKIVLDKESDMVDSKTVLKTMTIIDQIMRHICERPDVQGDA